MEIKHIERKNALEYLKEFKNNIPTKKSLLNRQINVDAAKINNIEDKIISFYERKVLISPMSINKDSINIYIENLNLIKQFPNNLKPDILIESKISDKTKNAKNTRTILLPNIVESNSKLLEDYDAMIAYYLIAGGNNPLERFSKIEMQMKQYGIKPDLGISIMKYGDEITNKLEELAMSNGRNSKEWECFKNQVIHTFEVAESIGNRDVNKEEHLNWEDRLVRLGILEKRLNKENNSKQDFKKSIVCDLSSDKDNKDESKQTVMIETAIQKNAEQIYINTGMIPIGYKKDENGKIVRILPKIPDEDRKNRLSASRENNENKKRNLLLR